MEILDPTGPVQLTLKQVITCYAILLLQECKRCRQPAQVVVTFGPAKTTRNKTRCSTIKISLFLTPQTSQDLYND